MSILNHTLNREGQKCPFNFLILRGLFVANNLITSCEECNLGKRDVLLDKKSLEDFKTNALINPNALKDIEITLFGGFYLEDFKTNALINPNALKLKVNALKNRTRSIIG